MQHKNNKESDRRSFALGDIAKEIRVKKFVLRNWEKEFNFISQSDNGKRLYSDQEIKLFAHIKKLIYEDGLSIMKVREELGLNLAINQEQSLAATQGARIASGEQDVKNLTKDERQFLINHIESIKIQLYALRHMIQNSSLPLSKKDTQNYLDH